MTTYGTDIGAPCYDCDGTIFQYQTTPGERIVEAQCSSCLKMQYFALPEDANGGEVIADVRRAHHAAREMGGLFRDNPTPNGMDVCIVCYRRFNAKPWHGTPICWGCRRVR